MNSSRASVLLFGGGLIGSAAAFALSQAGNLVTVITRTPEPQGLDGVDWQFGSLDSLAGDDVLAGRGAVVYAAGSMSPASQVRSVAQTLNDQVVPVVALAERAAAAAIPVFVFISSGGTVYGQTDEIPTPEHAAVAPINAYGMVKAQTEQALFEVSRRTGMTVVILRVANPYGPGQQGTRRVGFIAAAVEAVKRGQSVNIWGDGTATRDFIHLDDVASAVVRSTAYRGESRALNVATGQETSLLQVCELVSELAGRPLPVTFHPARTVDVQRNCLAIERAADVLGWTPKIALREGVSGLIHTAKDAVPDQ